MLRPARRLTLARRMAERDFFFFFDRGIISKGLLPPRWPDLTPPDFVCSKQTSEAKLLLLFPLKCLPTRSGTRTIAVKCVRLEWRLLPASHAIQSVRHMSRCVAFFFSFSGQTASELLQNIPGLFRVNHSVYSLSSFFSKPNQIIHVKP